MSNLIVYATNCSWIGDIDDCSKLPEGLPCCPHCGSTLLQADKADWLQSARDFDRNHPGYFKFLEWAIRVNKTICLPGPISLLLARYNFKHKLKVRID